MVVTWVKCWEKYGVCDTEGCLFIDVRDQVESCMCDDCPQGLCIYYIYGRVKICAATIQCDIILHEPP